MNWSQNANVSAANSEWQMAAQEHDLSLCNVCMQDWCRLQHPLISLTQLDLSDGILVHLGEGGGDLALPGGWHTWQGDGNAALVIHKYKHCKSEAHCSLTDLRQNKSWASQGQLIGLCPWNVAYVTTACLTTVHQMQYYQTKEGADMTIYCNSSKGNALGWPVRQTSHPAPKGVWHKRLLLSRHTGNVQVSMWRSAQAAGNDIKKFFRCLESRVASPR